MSSSVTLLVTLLMDSNKLKALKVVDLKAIAAKAKLQVPAKATKSDIIAKILASQAALDAYSLLYPSPLAQDDLLAPPEEYFKRSLIATSLSFTPFFYSVDWSEDPVVAPTPAVKEPKQLVADPEPPTPPPAVTDIDPELEKRQKRAERFGIPFIEPKKPSTPVSDVGLFPLRTNDVSYLLFSRTLRN